MKLLYHKNTVQILMTVFTMAHIHLIFHFTEKKAKANLCDRVTATFACKYCQGFCLGTLQSFMKLDSASHSKG